MLMLFFISIFVVIFICFLLLYEFAKSINTSSLLFYISKNKFFLKNTSKNSYFPFIFCMSLSSFLLYIGNFFIFVVFFETNAYFNIFLFLFLSEILFTIFIGHKLSVQTCIKIYSKNSFNFALFHPFYFEILAC